MFWSDLLDAFDRVLEKISGIERAGIVILLSVLTLAALLRLDEIFDTYPVCAEQQPCATVKVFVGDMVPDVTFNWSRWEFELVEDPADFEFRPLNQTELEGTILDPMMASGLLVAFLALWASLPMDRLFREMIEQLSRDRIIEWTEDHYDGVEGQRLRLAFAVASVVFVLMFVGYFIYYGGIPSGYSREFFFASVLLGAIAGHRLGSAAAYGFFARSIRTSGAPLRIFVGHADKMGGFRRLGEFLAYQCILCSIPIIWLATWLYLEIQRPDIHFNYVGWILLHAALLVVSLCLFWLSFLRPFFQITGQYRQARARLRAHYRAMLRVPLEQAQTELRTATSWSEQQDAIGRLSKLSGTLELIDALPRVPMRSAVSGAFSLSALYPFATLVTGLLVEKGTGLGEAIGTALNVFKLTGL